MSTTAVMTEGGLGRVWRRKARKILKRPSRRRGRHCLHIFDFYYKVLQSWLPLERFVAFFCKVLMMAIYQRTSSFFLMTLTYPKTQIFLMKAMGNLTLMILMTVSVYPSFVFVRVTFPVLSEALHPPNYFTCRQGTICDGIEGLCIALRRLGYPCRLSDLIPRFGRRVPELNIITSLVMDTIY